MKKLVLSLIIITMLPNTLYTEDYLQWIKNNCTEIVLWRCVGIFCVTLVAADTFFPFAQKKINNFRGIKEESFNELCEREIATTKVEIENSFNEKIIRLKDDLKITNDAIIQNKIDIIKLIDDCNENYQLIFINQGTLTKQKDDLIVEINVIKRIIEERKQEKELSQEKKPKFVVQMHEPAVKECNIDTYSKRELDIFLEAFKKECNKKNKKSLTKIEEITKRHIRLFADNKALMNEIINLKKEYVPIKDLIGVFAEESNKLTFDLYKFQARASLIENSLNQLENFKDAQKGTLTKLKKRQSKKKRRSSWSDNSDSSDSNPNTPRSKVLEDILVSPRSQTSNFIVQLEGEKEL